MAGPDYQDRFHRTLAERLSLDVSNRMTTLCSGGAADYPSYRYQVGMIEALTSVLSLCADIERDMYGPQEKPPQQE